MNVASISLTLLVIAACSDPQQETTRLPAPLAIGDLARIEGVTLVDRTFYWTTNGDRLPGVWRYQLGWIDAEPLATGSELGSIAADASTVAWRAGTDLALMQLGSSAVTTVTAAELGGEAIAQVLAVQRGAVLVALRAQGALQLVIVGDAPRVLATLETSELCQASAHGLDVALVLGAACDEVVTLRDGVFISDFVEQTGVVAATPDDARAFAAEDGIRLVDGEASFEIPGVPGDGRLFMLEGGRHAWLARGMWTVIERDGAFTTQAVDPRFTAAAPGWIDARPSSLLGIDEQDQLLLQPLE